MNAESILALLDASNTILMIVVVGAVALAAYRLIKGPSYADRFVSIDMMTGLLVAACALTALATGRDEFLDVAFALALIAFVATAAFAAFLEGKVAVTNRQLLVDSARKKNALAPKEQPQ
ncbi:MAG: monovalent cation/H+ antiporter complex subunit F [Pseudomonadota bacterium]